MIGQSKVKFLFSTIKQSNNNYAVEKDLNGVKRRYIEGVASGSNVDGHGEVVTQNCIMSFMKQANSGDVLLYPDIHGIRSTDDIGILVAAKVLDNGDWWVRFRLYDKLDKVAARNIEVADMEWKQLCGLPPYTKPRQKGFSIEGDIPEGGIKDMIDGDKRVMDDIILDGVVLVPKPAYKASVAMAVQKALIKKEDGMLNSTNAEGLIRQKLVGDDNLTTSYARRTKIQDTFDSLFEDICKSDDPDKDQKLSSLMDEYKAMMSEELGVKKSVLSTEQVNKNMLSPEEQALMNNIGSLINQLGQLKNAEQDLQQNTDEVNMSEDFENTGNPPTSDPTGNNDAVEMTDEEIMKMLAEDGEAPLSEESDENAEFAKALAKALKEDGEVEDLSEMSDAEVQEALKELGEPDGDESEVAMALSRMRARKADIEAEPISIVPENEEGIQEMLAKADELEDAAETADDIGEVQAAKSMRVKARTLRHAAKSASSRSRKISYERRPVAKSATTDARVLKAISEMGNLVMKLSAENREIKKSLNNLLTGIGVTDAIVQKSSPILNTNGYNEISDLLSVKKSLKDLEAEGKVAAKNPDNVRKSLRSSLTHMFAGQGGRV